MRNFKIFVILLIGFLIISGAKPYHKIKKSLENPIYVEEWMTKPFKIN